LQPHLIDKIIKAAKLDLDEVKTKDVPMASSCNLNWHLDSNSCNGVFHCRSVIGMPNYLNKGSHSDVACATHQCTHHVEDPKVEHANAVKWLVQHTKGTQNKGTNFCSG